MAEINVGNNANLLKGAIDSHDVHNSVSNVDNSTTNNVVNNTTNTTTNHSCFYEAQRTQQEIIQENENQFLLAVQERYADGVLTPQEMAELQQIALKCKIDPMRANLIIDEVRKSMEIINGSQGNEFLMGQILNEIFNAVQANDLDIINRKFNTLEHVAKTSTDNNLQYYYHMLLASLHPENCTVGFINSRTDNYWQLYWAHVAYVKLGNIDNGTVLLPRLGGFGCPQGDTALLMAIDNIAEYQHCGKKPYYHQQAQQYLEQACALGLSEQLSPLWYAANEMLKDEQCPDEWFRFYCESTLKELNPPQAPAFPEHSAQIPSPPPIPKFNAQNVNLKQMQGFNPLQAAKSSGLNTIPSMEQTQQQMEQMRAKIMNRVQSMRTPGMPPMPSAGAPSMPASGAIPSMPTAPIPPIPTQKATKEKVELIEPNYTPEEEEQLEQYGIIYTDSISLSEKYGCLPQDVYDIINGFIENSAANGMHWYLLDAGHYRDSIDKESWEQHNELLGQYISENGFQMGVGTPVFIIGGSDVIPVPMLENPQWGDDIPTDMAYCFVTSFFDDIKEGNQTLDYDQVRNTVARLPLETGLMNTPLQDDLQSYFNLCSICADGIDVQGVVMATNAEWTNNSVTMSQHLPLFHHNSNDTDEIYKGMYMCPKLVTDTNDTCLQINHEALSHYQEAIDKAGMLLFNLHGAYSQGASGFYCEGGGGYPESFNIELMQQSNARVFNTVACFGARYDGYVRNDSMVMSSLLGGGKLLYAGSTVSVPMISDDQQNYPQGATQYPGSGSEKFMPIYCYYLFCGIPAGQAMMQAKIDYFNTFRHIERDDFSLATIMMFGLYGNPMLHVRKRSDVMEASLQYEVLPQSSQSKAANPAVRVARKNRLIDKYQLQSSKSLLDQIRGCVDNNLSYIHSMVMQNLYNALGLEPRWLEQIDSFALLTDNGVDEGYVYYFDADNKQGRKAMVETDRKGNINRYVTYK